VSNVIYLEIKSEIYLIL